MRLSRCLYIRGSSTTFEIIQEANKKFDQVKIRRSRTSEEEEDSKEEEFEFLKLFLGHHSHMCEGELGHFAVATSSDYIHH